MQPQIGIFVPLKVVSQENCITYFMLVLFSTPSGALSAQDFQNAMMGGAAGAANANRSDLNEVLRPDQVIGTGILRDPEGMFRYY